MTYWEEGVEKELESCKMKKDYVERANCIFDLLERITRVQDVVQLSIPAINESVGISQSMINNANAIILELSKFMGNLEPIIKHRYLKEKIMHLITDYNALAHDFNITNKEKTNLFTLKEVKEPITVDEKTIKHNRKEIFRNLVFNYPEKRWEKLKEIV